jgi:S1-C subfamily serine protease
MDCYYDNSPHEVGRPIRKWPIFLAFAIAVIVTGAVFADDTGMPANDVALPKGVGFQGAVPSYLTLLKVERGHSGEFEWYGSGSFISKRLVLTCHHNIEGIPEGGEIRIQMPNGRTYRTVKVVHEDADVDLALLEVRDTLIYYHRVIDVEDSRTTSANVSSAGFSPSGGGWSLYGGVIGSYQGSETKGGPNIYRSTSAHLEPGMSGGPLINDGLKLHGIMVWRHETYDKPPKWIRSFFVRLSTVQKFLDSYDGPFEDSTD